MLSLIELQNKKVEAKRKKYEKDEMDEYLELVFNNYKQLLEENKKLENEKIELNKKIKTLSDGVQYYRSIETTLQKALILAEKTSKETKDAAILKAESIERDAHKRAETIIQRAEGEYNQIREKSVRLVQQFNQYKLQLREAANAQLQLVDGNEFDITEPVAENVTVAAGQVSNIDDVIVEDIVPDTELVAETVDTPVEVATSASETSVAEEPIIETVAENVLERAEGLTEEPEETPILDTSKEELLNADTIDLSNTLEVVQTEADNEANAEPDKNTVSSPAIAEVKEATVVKPVEARTIDATPVSIADTTKDKEDANVLSESTTEVTTSNDLKAEPTLEEVLAEKKEAASAPAGGGIPTLDSLLQDLNMNNKGNQNSDDPFEFLGSIDDDF